MEGETDMQKLRTKNMAKNKEDFYAQMKDIEKEVVVEQLYQALETCREWESVVDCTVDGIFLTDEKGVPYYSNSAYEKISGLKWEEYENVPVSEFVKRGYQDVAGVVLVEQSHKSVTLEAHFLRSDKRALISCNPIYNSKGEMTGIVSNLRDMESLYKLKQQLEQERKNSQKYQEELDYLRQKLGDKGGFVTEDIASKRVLNLAKQISAVDTTVLIVGETGVGKEEVAKFIHDNSPRARKPFIKINCSAITETLFESELFGYEPGAFTGANKSGKPGFFEVSDGGTLLLDEIGELSLNMQAKLLRVLQEKKFNRVGGTKVINSDVRIIAATNRDLEQMEENGEFRRDLYYRLSVVPIHVPPLRERKGDILPLIEFFLQKLNKKYGTNKEFMWEAKDYFLKYQWPGNVRELRNVVERSYVLEQGDLIGLQIIGKNTEIMNCELEEIVNLKEYLAQIEQSYIQKAYKKYGNIREAAASLGMKKSSFANKLKEGHSVQK